MATAEEVAQKVRVTAGKTAGIASIVWAGIGIALLSTGMLVPAAAVDAQVAEQVAAIEQPAPAPVEQPAPVETEAPEAAPVETEAETETTEPAPDSTDGATAPAETESEEVDGVDIRPEDGFTSYIGMQGGFTPHLIVWDVNLGSGELEYTSYRCNGTVVNIGGGSIEDMGEGGGRHRITWDGENPAHATGHGTFTDITVDERTLVHGGDSHTSRVDTAMASAEIECKSSGLTQSGSMANFVYE